MTGTFVFIAILQVFNLVWIGNGLPRLSDPNSEADVLRSAQAYAKDGLTSHHGLPRTMYGPRYPEWGTSSDQLDTNGLVAPKFRIGFPESQANPNEWVYTHYPPLSNLVCGAMARLFGFDPTWRLRLPPLCFGLAATGLFFMTLARVFGAGRAAFIAIGCALLPMFSTNMAALHYEGYSFALLLLQLCLLISLLWRSSCLSRRQCAVFFLIGFIQGWLSFDLFFIVSLIAVPLWLFRRAEGREPSARWLLFATAMPCLGFGLAHFLHLLQVAAELGGLRQAVAEFTHTAAARAGESGHITLPLLLQGLGFSTNSGHLGFMTSLALTCYYYVREVLILRSEHFGPFLLLAILAAFPLAVSSRSRTRAAKTRRWTRVGPFLAWPGPKRVWPAMGMALLVSMMWCFAMPAHTVGNRGITVRHLFVLYFLLLLVLARSISFRSESLAQPAGGSAG